VITLLDTYRGGYKKALLDLRGTIESLHGMYGYEIKSKKQFQKLMISFLDLLLADPETLDGMMETGYPTMVITPQCECRPAREFGKKGDG